MGRLSHHSPKYGAVEGLFSAAYHLEMIHDRRRVLPFFRAIERAAACGRIFLELGCGSGIFSKHAATKFQKVIAVEKDPFIFRVAKENLKDEIQNGRLCLLNCDAADIPDSLLSDVDVIFCEMMSTWLLVEPQVQVVRTARERLKGRRVLFIPSIVYNTIELVTADFRPFGIQLQAPFVEFTGILPAESISLPKISWKLDFANDEMPNVRAGTIKIRALLSGAANAVRLQSPIQVAEGIPFSGSDSLMPPTIVPVSTPIIVEAGDEVKIKWKIAHRSPLEGAKFDIERV